MQVVKGCAGRKAWPRSNPRTWLPFVHRADHFFSRAGVLPSHYVKEGLAAGIGIRMEGYEPDGSAQRQAKTDSSFVRAGRSHKGGQAPSLGRCWLTAYIGAGELFEQIDCFRIGAVLGKPDIIIDIPMLTASKAVETDLVDMAARGFFCVEWTEYRVLTPALKKLNPLAVNVLIKWHGTLKLACQVTHASKVHPCDTS